MIKHIVMWSFKEGCEKEADAFLEALRGLYGVIPEIRSLQVGKNLAEGEEYDAVLMADFDSLEDLERYKNDPRHVAVASLCKAIRLSRAAMDIEA